MMKIKGHQVFLAADKIVIGCKSISQEDMKGFFTWYYGETKKYRFLLWDSGNVYNPINIYRSGGNIRVYHEDKFDLYSEKIAELFILCSEHWGWPND